MTIEELKEALERIPNNNAINKARRRCIIMEINRILSE